MIKKMNLETFEKTKQELETVKQENNKKVRLYDERRRMSKVNQFEYKATSILAFSMVAYLIYFIVSATLIKNLSITAFTKFTNVFHALSFSVIVVIASLCLGTLINTFMYKKCKTKERLNSFSTAKTQTEKLEEEIHYEIELEKVSNRNLVIEQAIAILNSNEVILRQLSGKYDISYKRTEKTKEDVKKRVEELSTFIKEQYDKLDILSTQKVLHERFWKIRSKFTKVTDIFGASIFSGTLTTFFILFPFILVIMVNDITTSNLFATLAIIFTPFIAGSVSAIVYMIIRNKIYKKVFDNLNSKLGENALPELLDNSYDSDYEKKEEFKTLLENKIRDISLATIQLKEKQEVLEKLDT